MVARTGQADEGGAVGGGGSGAWQGQLLGGAYSRQMSHKLKSNAKPGLNLIIQK